MKNTILSTLAALAASWILLPSFTIAAPDPNFHIYLMLGQSNMEGSAPIQAQDKNAHPNVSVLQSQSCDGHAYGTWRPATPPLIRCTNLGPGDTFGKIMAENAPNGVKIGLVGGAYGGAKIEYFMKNCGGNCNPPYGGIAGAPSDGRKGGYLWVIDLAKKAQQKGVIKGFIFHQGESNSGQGDWPQKVNTYITNLRKDLGLNAADVPFIAGELPYTGCCKGHNAQVAKIPNVVANGHIVTAEGGLGDKGDRLHWDSAAVREMGKRYAAKMLTVSNIKAVPSPVPVPTPMPTPMPVPINCGDQNGTPICCDISADPEGDGMGSQNNKQCIVTPETEGWHAPNPDDVVAAINAGGSGDSVQYNGIWYEADKYSNGGTANDTNEKISGGDDSDLFTSERWGSNFSYEIPVSNGTYSVEIGLVELYVSAGGDRVITITAENETVVSDFDVFDKSGGKFSLYMTPKKVVSVNDGKLTINISGSTLNGTLSSILVRKADKVVASSSSSSVVSQPAASVASTPASSIANQPASSVASVPDKPVQASPSSSSASDATTGGVLDGALLLLLSLLTSVFLTAQRRTGGSKG